MALQEKILITGAAGFIGSAVARAALAQGHDVRLLVRASSPRANVDALRAQGAEIVEADMRDEAAVERALAGCASLLHVAADYRLWARDPEDIVRNNLEGAGAVMRAALAAGTRRVVYTSSVATLKVGPDTVNASEDQPARAEEAIGAYKRSKIVAERLVERMIGQDGLPAVIVNPSTPIGAHDVRPTPTGRIIVEAACGRMPAFVETGLNVVDVDDVARGHLLALARGRVGQRYILGGENLMLRELLGEIAQLAGRRAPRVRLPVAPLIPLAHVAQALAHFNGREPFMTVDGLRMSRNRMFFTSAKAERELGYRPRGYREALRSALDWFAQAGYLK
ncbi:hopanoid-associated sugar epimerase [Massilia sp. 9096]|uniref:hopanoid-associated sugar epimerase n=1 Tax=Massilia sp. 9096 TaxID=1500894 RepID=UPI00055D09A0|nr:hopanoid-associated sugar epimerase [Massilia sp. 9096]